MDRLRAFQSGLELIDVALGFEGHLLAPGESSSSFHLNPIKHGAAGWRRGVLVCVEGRVCGQVRSHDGVEAAQQVRAAPETILAIDGAGPFNLHGAVRGVRLGAGHAEIRSAVGGVGAGDGFLPVGHAIEIGVQVSIAVVPNDDFRG